MYNKNKMSISYIQIFNWSNITFYFIFNNIQTFFVKIGEKTDTATTYLRLYLGKKN